MDVDHTHDPGLRSWVASANGHPDFPIQNLPLGVFAPPGGAPRGGVAIGDMILDLGALRDAGLLDGAARVACEAGAGPTLNALLALGAGPRRALRAAVSGLLAEGAAERPALLHRAADCAPHMPARVGDYTDFYAGIHHATNAGRLFRPDSPLPPNYKFVPIGYHGRASSLRPSGIGVRRPDGQRKRPDQAEPSFGPCERLDYELELGVWVGPGNALGTPVPIGRAHEHIGGYCLLNDWSARDLQAWESQPLGPFLTKSFHTTISPWIVTPEALAPFRSAQPSRPAGDPAPLPYLLDEADQRTGALDLELEALLLTQAMRARGTAPHRLSLGTALNLYWTPAQLLAHHASNGCNLDAGDLLGTGTISSPTPDGQGSLIEMTQGGREPVRLPSGEARRFLEDGDEVILRARARRGGFVPIGFGECRGIVAPVDTSA
ncbi:MAG: fumarylacetoacetase [Acetobacteraceae bacterium]|nr:fumarylacetoacetase [Acetobacteraceae bacterium]